MKYSDSELENIYCFTCKTKIDFDPIRIIVFERNGLESLTHFHYFFPCWDPDYVINSFADYRIVSAGFSFDEQSLNPKTIKNYKKNLDLWI